MNIVLLGGQLVSAEKSTTKTGWCVITYVIQESPEVTFRVKSFSKNEIQNELSNGEWVVAQCKLTSEKKVSKAGYEFQSLDLKLLKIAPFTFDVNPLADSQMSQIPMRGMPKTQFHGDDVP